jgi:acetoin utilization protein AcuC
MAGIVPRVKGHGHAAEPLLVFGPLSATYDFGPSHPLTPRRFGPGIDLLGALGAEPGLAPEPAPDGDLVLCHSPTYLAAVRRASIDPFGAPEAGIAPGGDDPPFPGMHDAGAMVAGGSMRAMEAILRGDVQHAFHPGGGLHHAMRDRASGFCIYDDPALAIALARRAGLRVLYVDLDVHHGDGVQALHLDDPGVVTISFHESGRTLFPGTGFIDELGEGAAAGTSINVPLAAGTGEDGWLAAVRAIVPPVAAAFDPAIVVSQHGADSHAWDPLAHLRVTTTAMGAAARLVDAIAHRYAAGRWLSTGGGGYDAYRVVPRSWSLVWLAGAHREAPDATPPAWRERWADEAARFGQAPLPGAFVDPPNAGQPPDDLLVSADALAATTAELVRRIAVPALLRAAEERGWWSPSAAETRGRAADRTRRGTPTILDGPLSRAELDRLGLAERVISPAGPAEGLSTLRAAVAAGARAHAAVVGDAIVGLAIAAPEVDGPGWDLLAVGVAPEQRRAGLGRELVRRLVESSALAGASVGAVVTVGERDPVDPLPVETRRAAAIGLLTSAGFTVSEGPHDLARVDRWAFSATRT